MIDILIEEILEDLLVKLHISAEDEESKNAKVTLKSVVDEVMSIRDYPPYYTDEMIYDDLRKYRSKILRIAHNDCDKDGIEFQKSHSESDVNMSFVDRETLFSGIYRLAKF